MLQTITNHKVRHKSIKRRENRSLFEKKKILETDFFLVEIKANNLLQDTNSMPGSDWFSLVHLFLSHFVYYFFFFLVNTLVRHECKCGWHLRVYFFFFFLLRVQFFYFSLYRLYLKFQTSINWRGYLYLSNLFHIILDLINWSTVGGWLALPHVVLKMMKQLFWLPFNRWWVS